MSDGANIRHGIDIVDRRRFDRSVQRYGDRLLGRIFTVGELQCKELVYPLAALFAAKEAFLKALGTGLARGMSWRQIAIKPRAGGGFDLAVSGAVAELLDGRRPLVDMSSTESTAAALVVVEGRSSRCTG